MKFFIRVWSESTVVLMTESGHVLSYFTTVKDALSACEEWYSCNSQEYKHEVQVQYNHNVKKYSSVAAMA